MLELEYQLPKYEERLKRLQACQPSAELVEDLLANAQRRLEEGRYEDAAARTYRALEAVGQYRLLSQYGLATHQVPLARVPEPLRKEWAKYANREGNLRLPLQQAYQLLEGLGDPLGERFRALRLFSEPGRPSLLDVRDRSICAHGFDPIREDTARKLFSVALELAGLRQDQLLQFPTLHGPLR